VRRLGRRGFTLIELMLALSIVATLLVVTFAGLRVGLGSWRRGEDRAEAQQHVRGLLTVLSRTVAGAYPYQVGGGDTPPAILFRGESDRVALVSTAAPFPTPIPAAFTAVTFAMEGDEAPGLAVRQKILPNLDPFEALRPLLVDTGVVAARFRFLRGGGGSWEERWDAATEQALPRAVEISLTTRLNNRTIQHAPLTIAIAVGAP